MNIEFAIFSNWMIKIHIISKLIMFVYFHFRFLCLECLKNCGLRSKKFQEVVVGLFALVNNHF